MIHNRALFALLAFLLLGGCVHTADRATDDVPAMVRIEPGTFTAGSPSGETQAAGHPPASAAREQPQRTVTIRQAFAIGRTEVTRGQFARFVAATGWRPDGPCSWLSDGPANSWETDSAHDWRNPGFMQGDDHPVVCVNLADAQAYARWLSAMTRRTFRLPAGDE